MRGHYLLLILCLALIGLGCARGENPATPSSSPSPEFSALPAHAGAANRILLGLWTISISADRTNPVLIPDRMAGMHLNVVRLLENGSCSDCLTISEVQLVQPNELFLFLTLKHPFPEYLNYMGFDVRGILISGADYMFPDSGRWIARGDTHLRLINYDGYTTLFNPTEFPEGGPNPPILSYITGKYATGGDLSSTLNPFIAYMRNNERRIFFNGHSNKESRKLHLALPDGPLEFGYAIDVCWEAVDGEINDPIEDYPPEANCLEAYEIAPEIVAIIPPDNTGAVNVQVFDHQGLDTISEVTIEAPDLFDGTVALEYNTKLDDERFLYTGSISNEHGADSGDYPALIKVTDTREDPNFGQILAWDITTVRVGPKNGWVRTWGGIRGFASCNAVTAVESGGIYVAGQLWNPVDFDPGPGIDERDIGGAYGGCYLARYDSEGGYHWVRAWGSGDYMITADDIAIDSIGNVYVVGLLDGTVDFDPGPGTYERTSNGDYDCYVSKFNILGEFQWAQTWGGDLDDHAYDAAVDEFDSVYIAGSFRRTVDFDPGPEPDEITSAGSYDCFLVRYEGDGTYNRVRTWGGQYDDRAWEVATDNNSCVYVGGRFERTIDLDPGPETDEHTAASIGPPDIFLSKFDSDGNYTWGYTWGGEQNDSCNGLAVTDSGTCYITGNCIAPVDFDPGPGIDDGNLFLCGIYVSSFNADGSFNWVLTWDYPVISSPSISVNELGGASLAGYYEGTIDLDPGPNSDLNTAWDTDQFLLKIDTGGEVLWSQTWDSTGSQDHNCLSCNAHGDAFVTGSFWGRVDFEPGPGTEWRTTYNTAAFLLNFPSDGNW